MAQPRELDIAQRKFFEDNPTHKFNETKVGGSKMPPFKPEHILIIEPGSLVTKAQLGIPEFHTPAKLRLPSRMFRGEKPGEWEPVKIREKTITQKVVSATGDKKEREDGLSKGDAMGGVEHEVEEVIYEEDPDSDEGAVYPLQNGRIKNWSCFYALLQHVYNLLSPPFHTPILLITQPVWSKRECEYLVNFMFEKFQPPGLSLLDSAKASFFAHNVPVGIVIDVGYTKCDVTAVTEGYAAPFGRVTALPECGGENLTNRLFDLLGPKGFSKDMCEKLKQSNICEVLAPGVPYPSETEQPASANPAAATASTGINGSKLSEKASSSQTNLPRGPGSGTEVGEEQVEDNEGVLDVASIVASGKTTEFLAKKEKEKADKNAAKKNAAEAAAAAKAAKMPNSQRAKAMFYYEERQAATDKVNGEVNNAPEQVEKLNGEANMNAEANNAPEQIKNPNGEATNMNGDAANIPEQIENPATGGQTMNSNGAVPKAPKESTVESNALSKNEEQRRSKDNPKIVRKEIEVGIERFKAADTGILDTIANTVWRVIHSPDVEIDKRSQLWENLMLVGNGARVRGFKEALLETLKSRFLISPSSATIFTSELPSNFSTPAPTGANTPLPQVQPSHHASGVNPLLLAATTASNPSLAPPSHQQSAQMLATPGGLSRHHSGSGSSHSGQAPTSIRYAKGPDHFSQYREVGFAEAQFLGAQVSGMSLFQETSNPKDKLYMSRVEWNDLGPPGFWKNST